MISLFCMVIKAELITVGGKDFFFIYIEEHAFFPFFFFFFFSRVI